MSKGSEADPFILETLYINSQGLTTTELAKVVYPEITDATDRRKIVSFLQYRLQRLIGMGLVTVEKRQEGRRYTLKEGAVVGPSLLLISKTEDEDDVVHVSLGKVLAIVSEDADPRVMFLDS